MFGVVCFWLTCFVRASELILFFLLAKFQDPTNHARRFPRRSSGHLLSPGSQSRSIFEAASPLPCVCEKIYEDIHNEKSPHFWDLYTKKNIPEVMLFWGVRSSSKTWWLMIKIGTTMCVYANMPATSQPPKYPNSRSDFSAAAWKSHEKKTAKPGPSEWMTTIQFSLRWFDQAE